MTTDKHVSNRAIIWFAVGLAICVSVVLTLALVYIFILAQNLWLALVIFLLGVVVLFCLILFAPNWLYERCCHEPAAVSATETAELEGSRGE